VLVAPAAGLAVAIALRTNLPPALQAATATKTPVQVIEVKPLPNNDPSGITPFYLALGLVVANYIGAVVFAFVFGAKPVGRRVWWRILGVGIMALGLGEVGIVNAIGPLPVARAGRPAARDERRDRHRRAAVALRDHGHQRRGAAVRRVGQPRVRRAVRHPAAAGSWRTIGPYLPAGAGTDLVRNVVYFDASAITRPLLVLWVWLALALVVAGLPTRTRPLGLQMQSDRTRLEAAREATANG
jgi:hypothetical protein